MIFDLLTWISKEIIYLSWTIYLPSLKLVGQSIVELSVAQGIRDQHDLWPEYQLGSSTHQGLSTYQVWSFWGKVFLSYQFCTRLRETDIPTDMCNVICPPFSKGGIKMASTLPSGAALCGSVGLAACCSLWAACCAACLKIHKHQFVTTLCKKIAISTFSLVKWFEILECLYQGFYHTKATVCVCIHTPESVLSKYLRVLSDIGLIEF